MAKVFLDKKYNNTEIDNRIFIRETSVGEINFSTDFVAKIMFIDQIYSQGIYFIL